MRMTKPKPKPKTLVMVKLTKKRSRDKNHKRGRRTKDNKDSKDSKDNKNKKKSVRINLFKAEQAAYSKDITAKILSIDLTKVRQPFKRVKHLLEPNNTVTTASAASKG